MVVPQYGQCRTSGSMVCIVVGIGRGVVRAIGITSKLQGYLWCRSNLPHTLAQFAVLVFFRLPGPGGVEASVAGPDVLAVRRGTPMGCPKHVLRLDRLRRRWQSSPPTGLCDLAIIPYPPIVLFNRAAEPAWFASESQGRAR